MRILPGRTNAPPEFPRARASVAVVAALAALAALGPAPASADAPRPTEPRAEAEAPRAQRLVWPARRRQPGWGEVITAGALGAGVLALHWVGSTETPGWTRVSRFDAALRDGLRATDGRLEAVRTASDVLLLTTAAYPILVEDLGIVLVGDRNPELLAEMIAIDAQSYAVMGILVSIVKVASSRQRPYAFGAGCDLDPAAPGCGDQDRNRSFFSGHSAMAFTGAGLACFHQRQLPNLYGSRAAGVGVCASAMGFATSTALLRVIGDMHWSTDVLAGAGVGLFSGWVLPWLLHGRALLAVTGENVSGAIWPIIERGRYGMAIRGSFSAD